MHVGHGLDSCDAWGLIVLSIEAGVDCVYYRGRSMRAVSNELYRVHEPELLIAACSTSTYQATQCGVGSLRSAGEAQDQDGDCTHRE